jgi:hypothetical protein
MLPGRSLEAAGNRRPRGMIAARSHGNRIRLIAAPDPKRGQTMSDMPVGDEVSMKPKKAADLKATSRMSGRLPRKVVIVLGVVAGALVVAYASGALSGLFGTAGIFSAGKGTGPKLTAVSPEKSESKARAAEEAESTPADPTQARLPLLNNPPLPEGVEKPGSSASVSSNLSESNKGQEATPPGGNALTGEMRPSAETFKAGERPGIVTREPQSAAVSDTEQGKKVVEKAVPEEPAATRDKLAAAAPSATDRPAEATGKKKKEGEEAASKKADAGVSASRPLTEPDARASSDRFQLPGYVKVHINNYSGATVKWGLMVILDDSQSMARKSKTFTPTRVHTAASFISKLPGALPSGSKLAIRDFECSKPDPKAKGAAAHCPTRMLYEWAEPPFHNLGEKLEQSHPGGRNNPCAAAAYSLKKDFDGAGALTPRILLLTDGATNCRSNEVLRAIDEQWGRNKVHVDVVVLGMHKKRKENYSILAKRTTGLFFTAESPSDLDAAIARYTKILKTPTLEKVEIRGENATLTANPDQEITLVPGSYSVTLPLVGGLNPAKRVIENVGIKSFEATELDVTIKKGKPIVKISRKPVGSQRTTQ